MVQLYASSSVGPQWCLLPVGSTCTQKPEQQTLQKTAAPRSCVSACTFGRCPVDLDRRPAAQCCLLYKGLESASVQLRPENPQGPAYTKCSKLSSVFPPPTDSRAPWALSLFNQPSEQTCSILKLKGKWEMSPKTFRNFRLFSEPLLGLFPATREAGHVHSGCEQKAAMPAPSPNITHTPHV